MIYTVEWTILLNTSSIHKSDRILQNIGQATGWSVEVLERKRNWKDTSKIIARANSAIQSFSFAGALHATMMASSRIAATWIVAAPGAGGPDYNATANLGSIMIPGIDSIAFRLSEGMGTESLLPAESRLDL